MATNPTDAKRPHSDQIDCLSILPEELLLTILSLLPTRTAARTSVLSRRFRHLWEASPSLDLIFRDLPKPKKATFFALADRLIFGRHPSHPLLSLHIEISGYFKYNKEYVSSLLAMLSSLNLRHLTIEWCSFSCIKSFIPAIFSMKSLESLSLPTLVYFYPFWEREDYIYTLPSASLTRLRSLTIEQYEVYPVKFNKLLSELPSLQYLHLGVRNASELTLSSQTIRTLKLVLFTNILRLRILGLSLPLLESFHLGNRGAFRLPDFQGEIPSLRKVVFNIHFILEEDATVVNGLLEYVSHAEDLILRIRESEHEMDPFRILWDLDEDPPKFPKLKHLDVSMCFHEYNFEAIVSMLHHCPALESVKLVHELAKFTGGGSQRTKRDWKSKLPRNADRNYRYAYFRNLHLGDNRKKLLQLLHKKQTSNWHAHCRF